MTTTMNISLPEALREYIDERVAEGGYSNVTDYIRALVRDDRANRAKAQLETKLLEGIASGPPVEATDEYWKRIEARVHAGIAKRRRKR